MPGSIVISSSLELSQATKQKASKYGGKLTITKPSSLEFMLQKLHRNSPSIFVN
jgi:hypothetical protein